MALQRGVWLICGVLAASNLAAQVPSPEAHFGFPVGSDRRIIDYHQSIDYLELLARASPRLEMEEYGRSTRDLPLMMLKISSPENLTRADEYREMSRQLAMGDAISPTELESLVQQAKAVLMVVCNIHAPEIGSSQMALEWAYQLATTNDPKILAWLDEVILLLVPSANPDGQIMISEWYRKHLGTDYEGGPMPWLYHDYTGHDLNRDWYMLTQKETKALSRVAYREWFPQVLVDEHQMGSTGPRVFVPPYANPVAENVHPMIWRLSGLIGSNMALRLEEAGYQGVIYGYAFDGYWVGGTRSTCFWKNTVGILTEVASARIATPIHIDPMELRGDRKGLPTYRAQVNFPNPWPGGWWRLRDIVDYHLVFSNSALETCARYKETLLINRYRLAREAIQLGESQPPYGWVVPLEQHDLSSMRWMVDLLQENGIEVYEATQSFEMAGESFPAGTVVLPASQPYRAFLKEMMEPQQYPRIPYAPGSNQFYQPYDVTGWTLPLLMGVNWRTVRRPMQVELRHLQRRFWDENDIEPIASSVLALSTATNASFRVANRLLRRGHELRRSAGGITVGPDSLPPGSWIASGRAAKDLVDEAQRERLQLYGLSEPPKGKSYRIQKPRIGIFQPWRASMDEGWTRWVLEQFEFDLAVIHPDDFTGKLVGRFDVLIIPSMDRSQIVETQRGKPGEMFRLPPPYHQGIGMRGIRSLRSYVEKGGTLVLMSEAATALMADLELPLENAADQLTEEQYSFPGTIVGLEVDVTHPLAFGMTERPSAYHREGPAFVTTPVAAPVRRDVVARFADSRRLVLSGWGNGSQYLRGRGAIVEFHLGEGRVVLMAPRVQHRAQTHATFKFLFNAIMQSAAASEDMSQATAAQE